MYKLKIQSTISRGRVISWTSLFSGKLNYGASFIGIPFSVFPPQHFYLFEVLFPNLSKKVQRIYVGVDVCSYIVLCLKMQLTSCICQLCRSFGVLLWELLTGEMPYRVN